MATPQYPPQYPSRYAAAYRTALLLLINAVKRASGSISVDEATQHAESIIRSYSITYSCPVCGGPLELVAEGENVNKWICKAGLGYHYVEVRTTEASST